MSKGSRQRPREISYDDDCNMCGATGNSCSEEGCPYDLYEDKEDIVD